MPNTFSVRPAEKADTKEIQQLYRVLDEEMARLQPDFFSVSIRPAETIRALIRREDADFLLAEQDGVPVGFALVENMGWTPEAANTLPHRYAELSDLAVLPEYRRRGAGTALLEAARHWAKERRLDYLELNVLSQNTSALELYRQNRFENAVQTMRYML